MSCDNNCDPCSTVLNENEGVASQLSNLTANLFGTLTKTITSGRAVWSQPCDPNDSLSAFARNDGEGLICYLLRVFQDYYAAFKGAWSILNSYNKRDVVTSGYSIYQASQDVPIGVDIANTSYWTLVLTAPVGPTGATGPAGSGSAINYAIATKTGNYTATNTDAVIFCDPAAPMTITLPLANSLSGKWFKIVNRTGAFTVTIARAGSDTINGTTSFPLSFANEGVTLVNDNSSKWSAW